MGMFQSYILLYGSVSQGLGTTKFMNRLAEIDILTAV